MKISGIILAGGKGERLKSVTHDKILLRIGAGSVISWSAASFANSKLFDELIISYRDVKQKENIAKELNASVQNLPKIKWVQGGEQRQDSVLNALRKISNSSDLVYIHDGARPFITEQDLKNLLVAAQKTGASALAKPVTDTIKRAQHSDSMEDLQLEDLERSKLYAMHTPQVFRTNDILNAYENINQTKKIITDCVAAYQCVEKPVSLVVPEQNNLKITNPGDVELANFLIHTGSIKKVFELAYT